MAKWSPVILLREVRDYQDQTETGDDATIGDLKVELERLIVEDQIKKSERKPRPRVKTKSVRPIDP